MMQVQPAATLPPRPPVTVSQEKHFLKLVCGSLVLLVAVCCAAVGGMILWTQGPDIAPVVLLIVGIVSSGLATLLLYNSTPGEAPPPALDLPPAYRSSWRKEYIKRHPRENLNQDTRSTVATQNSSRRKLSLRRIWTTTGNQAASGEPDLAASEVFHEHTPVAQGDITLAPVHAQGRSNTVALPRGLLALRLSSATRPERANSAPSSRGAPGPPRSHRAVTVTHPLTDDDGLPSYEELQL